MGQYWNGLTCLRQKVVSAGTSVAKRLPAALIDGGVYMSRILEAVFDEIEFRLAKRAASRAAKRVIRRRARKIGDDESGDLETSVARVTTLRGWIIPPQSRNEDASSMVTKLNLLVLLILMFLVSAVESKGQQLREVFRNVQQAVVIVRTEQRGLAPFPMQGLTSLNGLGSGVLISNDGKVLTAAHLVQAADRTIVEFSEGELIPARVIGCSFSADVALLQLEHIPATHVAATLGDSDGAEVGDEIFVVGAP